MARVAIPIAVARTYLNYDRANNVASLPASTAASIPPDTKFGSILGGIQIDMGGTPSKGLVVGASAALMPMTIIKATPSQTEAYYSKGLVTRAGVLVDVFPNPSSNTHFFASVGLISMSLFPEKKTNGAWQTLGGNALTDRLAGMYAAAGAGTGWWIGDEWSIGIQGRFDFAATKSAGDYDAFAGTATSLIPSIVLDLTYHLVVRFVDIGQQNYHAQP